MDLSQNRVNPQIEIDGVWNKIDLETDVLVARWMNPKHAAYIRKHGKQYQKAIKLDNLSTKEEKRFMAETMTECILLGWRGMKADGKDLVYSKDECMKVLNDPELSWFSDMVETFSKDLSMYKKTDDLEIAEQVKKS